MTDDPDDRCGQFEAVLWLTGGALALAVIALTVWTLCR